MNKIDLARAVAKRLSTTYTLSYDYINTLQDILTDELQKDGYVILQGFGVFTPWMQTERLGRNPKTGEPFVIEPRVSVKFKPGRSLLRALNQQEKKEKED